VQQFFTEHLITQRAVSQCTVSCYHDGLMLFLNLASPKLGMTPTGLQLIDIRSDLIPAFLDHLEQERHYWVRTRNQKLSALRGFLKFAAPRNVASLHVIAQALGVPMKCFER
jgi:site-specific recombinase XerD